MEGQEDPQSTGQESQATRRAADLARLINEDCSRLLELYVSDYYPPKLVLCGPKLLRAPYVAYSYPTATGPSNMLTIQ